MARKKKSRWERDIERQKKAKEIKQSAPMPFGVPLIAGIYSLGGVLLITIGKELFSKGLETPFTNALVFGAQTQQIFAIIGAILLALGVFEIILGIFLYMMNNLARKIAMVICIVTFAISIIITVRIQVNFFYILALLLSISVFIYLFLENIALAYENAEKIGYK